MIQRVRDVVGAILGQRALKPAADLFTVQGAWEQVLGERLGARARPLRLERGELLVAVPDAVWRQEMSFLTPEIKAGLNRALGGEKIERIRLIGTFDLTDEAPRERGRRLRPRDASDDLDLAHDEAATSETAESPLDLPGDIASALAALEQARAKRLSHDRSAPGNSARSKPEPPPPSAAATAQNDRSVRRPFKRRS